MKTYTLTALAAIIFICGCKKIIIEFPKKESVTRGLVAYYPFSGNAQDSTANHNNGIVHALQPAKDRKNQPNSAFYFNGTGSYVSVPFSNSLDLRTDFSISVWINPDTNRLSYGNYAAIVYHSDPQSGHDPYFLCYDVIKSNGMVGSHVGDGTIANMVQPQDNINFKNVWTHMVGTWNAASKTMKLYVNGQMVAHNTFKVSSIDYTTGTPAFMTFIGCVDKNYSYYKGIIDEVRIYNREISPGEVLVLMND